MMVGVTGATGFVGSEVARRLLSRGDRVVGFTRDVERARSRNAVTTGLERVEWRHFDPGSGQPQPDAFEGLDAVVNLAGETIASRWTPEKKRVIRASRVDGTRTLVASLAQLRQRPRVLVNASGIGYYGAGGDEPLDEDAPAGTDFLAEVAAAWESAAREAAALGIRVAIVRQATVIGDGGALAQLIPPFKFMIGGPLGSGRQWFPWIHIGDDARLILFALDDERVSGPLNAAAPDYATNARFAQALGNALRRPSLLPAPPFALHAVLGEFAGSLLEGQLAVPARALDLGFEFEYVSLERALNEATGNAARSSGTHRYAVSQFIAQAPEKVFAFFSDARNLASLTPPDKRFRMLTSGPIEMRRGTTIDYALRVGAVPVRWRTMITDWHPGAGFADVQLRGPFALWRHQHRFTPRDGGTLVEDDIEYALPLAPFGELAAPLVRADLEALFGYRRRRIEGLLTAV